MSHPHWTEEQQRWYEQACARLNPDRLRELLFRLTDIHSPTGATRSASEFMCDYISDFGVRADYMPINDISGNLLARRPGSGGGAKLLLYAPIDTHLEGDESDYPWAGPRQTIDMKPSAALNGDWVYGLGSSNPKAMVCTLAEIANALVDADVPLAGDLLLGFADGGMPVNIPERDNAGMSHGVEHLINRGMAPDYCIIMKPWNWVYHEEPGMGWFKVTVRGTLGYAGVTRETPGFRSSIVPAARVILALEEWLPKYTERNTSGVVRPDGWISALRSGWPNRPAFPSAATEIYFDVRINPRTTPAEVCAQVDEFLLSLCAEDPSLDMSWEMYGSTPGGTTDEQNWIIRSVKRGWEDVEGRPYPPTPDLLGGQTDGAALRRMGIPTARVGWPWPADGSPEEVAEGLGGMGATYVPDLMPCARKIIYAVIDTLTRTRADLGL
jgi:acetylornithine deacetylase/succinyl-diaminopimelate desuccinylase-like protein